LDYPHHVVQLGGMRSFGHHVNENWIPYNPKISLRATRQ